MASSGLRERFHNAAQHTQQRAVYGQTRHRLQGKCNLVEKRCIPAEPHLWAATPRGASCGDTTPKPFLQSPGWPYIIKYYISGAIVSKKRLCYNRIIRGTRRKTPGCECGSRCCTHRGICVLPARRYVRRSILFAGALRVEALAFRRGEHVTRKLTGSSVPPIHPLVAAQVRFHTLNHNR